MQLVTFDNDVVKQGDAEHSVKTRTNEDKDWCNQVESSCRNLVANGAVTDLSAICRFIVLATHIFTWLNGWDKSILAESTRLREKDKCFHFTHKSYNLPC